MLIYKIDQNRYTTYPKISAKRDFSPVFALIFKYVVCEFWPIFEVCEYFLVGWF